MSGSGGMGLSSLVNDVDEENEVDIKSFNVTIGARICCVNVKSFLLFFFVELNNIDKQHDFVLRLLCCCCRRFFIRLFFVIYPLDLVRLICDDNFSNVTVPFK
jgi:hypothetical protein